MSRSVTITINAVVEDSVTDDQLDYVAAAAMVQVLEPVLSPEDEGSPTFGLIHLVETTWTATNSTTHRP